MVWFWKGKDAKRDKAAAAAGIKIGPLENPFDFIGAPQSISPNFAYPTNDGYPVALPEEVLGAHQDQVKMAFRSFSGRAIFPGFDREFAQLMMNFASWVSLLPASKRYHHAKSGGLFSHSLDVAIKALHLSTGHIVNQDSSPRDRESDKFAWSVAAFCTALLHDIGKVESFGLVVARSVRARDENGRVYHTAPNERLFWRPQVGPLTEWMKRYQVETVVVEFSDDEKDGENHIHLIHSYFNQVVPTSMRSLIFNSNPRIGEMVTMYLTNPGSASRLPLFQIIADADHQSIQYDRNPRSLPGAVDLNTLIVRRFLEFASAQKVWNAPSSFFMHAYLEKRGAQMDGEEARHYFELDFFVTDEVSIGAFAQFLRSDDSFGLRWPDALEESIFEALLGSGVLHATIPGILPEAEPVDSLPDYIPATMASVSYSMKLSPSSTGSPQQTAIHDSPVIYEKPLLAIARSPQTGHRDYMPVISFHGNPGMPAKTLAVRIADGELRPADEFLDDDPVALSEIATATGLDSNSDDPNERSIARSLGRIQKQRKTHDLDLSDGERSVRHSSGNRRSQQPVKITREKTGGDPVRTPPKSAKVSDEAPLPGTPETAPAKLEEDAPVSEQVDFGDSDIAGDLLSQMGSGTSSSDNEQELDQPDEVSPKHIWISVAEMDWNNQRSYLGALLWFYAKAHPNLDLQPELTGSRWLLHERALAESTRITIMTDMVDRKIELGDFVAAWSGVGLDPATRRQLVRPSAEKKKSVELREGVLAAIEECESLFKEVSNEA